MQEPIKKANFLRLSHEKRVGLFVLAALVVSLVFAKILGVPNPFAKNLSFYITYQFAGGIEVGSPVRVSGIKVGRVEAIEFFVPESADAQKSEALTLKEPGSAETLPDQVIVPVRLKVSVSKDAAKGVRQDSRYYINLAGIIGERYIEITPGSFSVPQVKKGEVVRGVDPPRIDQLFSQSFNLAGKIINILDKNEGDIGKSIELLYKLSTQINQTLAWVDKSKVFKTDLALLVNNLIAITSSVKKITDRTNTPEGEKTLQLLYQLLWRLEPLDEKAIRNFLQKEGVKVDFF